MSEVWSEQQVIAAAPDTSSVKAARSLARPGPWTETGCTDTLVWGQCQGSGKTPYQVSVDVLAPAYRCSCPSRKFPCKHALALLLLWSAGDVVAGGGTADFAAEWADQRAERAEATATRRAARGEEAADPEAAQKRAAERLRTMDAGVDDFLVWLEDLARTGLAAARSRPYGWWDEVAARLVDAQLPGLADRVREVGGAVNGTDDWVGLLLRNVGRWFTLAEGWRRRDDLPGDEQAALRTTLGLPVPTAEVRGGEATTADWTVLGAHRDETGPLLQQRTWLLGPDDEVVVLLDTAGPGQALGLPQLAGAVLRASIARYPGPPVRRALIVDVPAPVGRSSGLGPAVDIASAVAAAADALAVAPWRDLIPVTLADVAIAPGKRAAVVDDSGAWLPIIGDGLHLAALTGGVPVTMFGELAGGELRVLSAVVDETVVTP